MTGKYSKQETTMKIGQMTTSKYLKGSDVDPPKLLTFHSFKKENVAKETEPPEHKWVAYFDGEEKGLVLNKVNLERAARAMGSDDTDDWIGKPIVVFYDPNVEFGGKLVEHGCRKGAVRALFITTQRFSRKL